LGSRSDPHLMYSPDVAITRDSKGYFYAAASEFGSHDRHGLSPGIQPAGLQGTPHALWR
jgi:hypothetical protein